MIDRTNVAARWGLIFSNQFTELRRCSTISAHGTVYEPFLFEIKNHHVRTYDRLLENRGNVRNCMQYHTIWILIFLGKMQSTSQFLGYFCVICQHDSPLMIAQVVNVTYLTLWERQLQKSLQYHELGVGNGNCTPSPPVQRR